MRYEADANELLLAMPKCLQHWQIKQSMPWDIR